MTKQQLLIEIHEHICRSSGKAISLKQVTKLFAERYPEFTFEEVEAVVQIWLDRFKEWEMEHAEERLADLEQELARRQASHGK